MGKFVTLILIIMAFALGIYVGRMPATSLVLDSVIPNSEKTKETITGAKGTSGTKVISSTQLSAEQRSLLSSFGINADNIAITQEMITCAEVKLGAARIDEIVNGAKPTFSEGLALLTCYNK